MRRVAPSMGEIGVDTCLQRFRERGTISAISALFSIGWNSENAFCSVWNSDPRTQQFSSYVTRKALLLRKTSVMWPSQNFLL